MPACSGSESNMQPEPVAEIIRTLLDGIAVALFLGLLYVATALYAVPA
jgi:hypothetical protein